jgi:hypothetical protein
MHKVWVPLLWICYSKIKHERCACTSTNFGFKHIKMAFQSMININKNMPPSKPVAILHIMSNLLWRKMCHRLSKL